MRTYLPTLHARRLTLRPSVRAAPSRRSAPASWRRNGGKHIRLSSVLVGIPSSTVHVATLTVDSRYQARANRPWSSGICALSRASAPHYP